MSQTLGVFMAIVTVMTFSLNYQRTAIQSQRAQVGSELEVMANAVGSEILNYIATKPYDASIAAETVTRENADPSLLTTVGDFGGQAYANCQDVDDFHAMVGHRVFFETENGLGFEFDVNVNVQYVTDDGQVSATPTWTKEVTVRISNAQGLFNPIQLTRHFSPQWY